MTQNFHCGRFVLNAERPLIMGIVNLTDDSFSGDGLHGDIGAAIAQGLRFIEEGAHILDLGAESSRPGAAPVPAQMEIDRLLPVIEALRDCGTALSIDTVKPEVMRVALQRRRRHDQRHQRAARPRRPRSWLLPARPGSA